MSTLKIPLELKECVFILQIVVSCYYLMRSLFNEIQSISIEVFNLLNVSTPFNLSIYLIELKPMNELNV